MKKFLCRLSIVIPIDLVWHLLMKPVTLSIAELGIYWQYGTTSFVFIMLTLVWQCCSPYRKSCCNGRWTEVLFCLFPAEVFLMAVFAQWHFEIFVYLVLFLAAVEFFIRIKVGRRQKKKHLLQRASLAILTAVCAVPCLVVVFCYDCLSPSYTADEDVWVILQSPAEEEESGSEDDIYEQNRALFRCLSEENWAEYSMEEKITVMQKLADFETSCLDIPKIPVTAELLGGYTLGQYSSETEEMWLNSKYLATYSLEECVETLCHEIYHFFQDYLIKNMDWDAEIMQNVYFSELRSWKENQENYKTSWSDGYDAYEQQPLETSAEEYARKETAKLLSYT